MCLQPANISNLPSVPVSTSDMISPIKTLYGDVLNRVEKHLRSAELK